MHRPKTETSCRQAGAVVQANMLWSSEHQVEDLMQGHMQQCLMYAVTSIATTHVIAKRMSTKCVKAAED